MQAFPRLVHCAFPGLVHYLYIWSAQAWETLGNYHAYCCACIHGYLLFYFTGSIGAHGSYIESAWPIHINDLNCTGSEESVWECPHNGIERYSCNHRQDASVMCQGMYIHVCTISKPQLSNKKHVGMIDRGLMVFTVAMPQALMNLDVFAKKARNTSTDKGYKVQPMFQP